MAGQERGGGGGGDMLKKKSVVCEKETIASVNKLCTCILIVTGMCVCVCHCVCRACVRAYVSVVCVWRGLGVIFVHSAAFLTDAFWQPLQSG